jgi:hypothetical protein
MKRSSGARGVTVRLFSDTTALHEYHCAVCGCLCYTPEAEPERTVFWDPASHAILCSAHSDVAAGTPAHPRLQEKWRFKR